MADIASMSMSGYLLVRVPAETAALDVGAGRNQPNSVVQNLKKLTVF